MANELLVSNWKIWYKSLDVNRDGKISIEDSEEARSKFSEFHQLDAEKRKQVIDNIQKWWNEFIFRGEPGEISESQFIDALNKKFTADKAKFHEHMSNCFNMIFEVFDTNKDGSISEEEFLIVFKAYGHENVAVDSKFFEAYNPVDGLVPLRKIVESWIEFTTNEDASKPSIVQTALKGVV